MHLKICRKIGDLLISKKQFDQGLMNGRAGVCIFLYNLSSKLSDNKYAEHADALLDGIYRSATFINNSSVDIVGIGWCIEYLIQNDFCEGDTDEILEQIDNKTYRILCGQENIPFNLEHGLLGYLQYLIMRLKKNDAEESNSKEINIELFKLVIDKLAQVTPEQFINLTKDIRFALFDNLYILFFSINSALKLKIYNEKIVNTLRQWESSWIAHTPSIHFNRLCLAIHLFQINKVLKSKKTENHIKCLLYSLDITELKSDIYLGTITSIDAGYLGLVWVLKRSIALLNSTYPNYNDFLPLMVEILDLCNSRLLATLDEKSTNNSKLYDRDFGIKDGWAGVGLLLLLYPDILENQNEKNPTH